MTNTSFDIKETGTIFEIRKVIARIHGLPTCGFGQPLVFSDGGRGMVIGYDKQEVLALLFNDALKIKAGDAVIAREEGLLCPVGDGFIGRIVNGLGEACDGKERIKADGYLPLFSEAPGIKDRASLSRQLHTGNRILDAMIPIAKGQRELIIGDRVTGKTTLAVDAILNQKEKDVVCIYCCVGRGYNFLVKLTQLLQEKRAFDYSLIVASTADAPAGQQYLAPYTAACIGEHFMRQGRDVLVVFDDLSKHAWVWREISLLMDRSPGREAYPGDIFYVHSQLMERAGQLSPERGGGSMTFLPIVETQQGDVTGYISSNLISMTDGQVYLSGDLFQEGFKPAIDLGLSVSRIGNKIQTPAMRALCGTLRLEYVQFRELLNLVKLRSTVSKEAQAKIKHGEAISEVLKQDKFEPSPLVEQIALCYAFKKNLLDELPAEFIVQFKKTFYSFLLDMHPGFAAALSADPELTFKAKEELDGILAEFFKTRLSVLEGR